MSLNSLRSLTNAAALATTAFDTARSTLKAMADAATAPATDQPTTGGDAPAAKPAPAAMEAARAAEPAQADAQPRKLKGVRKGLALDAYA